MNKKTSFILSKTEDLLLAVEKLVRCDLAINKRGFSLDQKCGISFKKNLLISEDGVEQIDSISVALFRSYQSVYQRCTRMARAINELCKQSDIEPLDKEANLSRLYDPQSYLYAVASDEKKLSNFKKVIRRTKRKEDDEEAIAALVKLLKKIGY